MTSTATWSNPIGQLAPFFLFFSPARRLIPVDSATEIDSAGAGAARGGKSLETRRTCVQVGGHGRCRHGGLRACLCSVGVAGSGFGWQQHGESLIQLPKKTTQACIFFSLVSNRFSDRNLPKDPLKKWHAGDVT